MSHKTRYLLLAVLFIFFGITSPFLVAYVKGITFDPQNGKFYKTGILGVKTQPKNSQVILNEKIVRTSEGNIKFLKAGEYNLKISSPNYQTWYKKLPIYEGLVTWANPENNKIFLLYQNPTELYSTNKVDDFIKIGNNIYYLSDNSLFEQSLSQIVEKFEHNLPKNFSNWKIKNTSPDEKIIVLKAEKSGEELVLYDIENKKFIETEKLIGSSSEIKKVEGNKIYALENKNLYEIDLYNKTKQLLRTNLEECLYTKDDFYFVSKDNAGLNIYAAQRPTAPATLIAKNLPFGQKVQIYINEQKRGFVTVDNKLYKISTQPELAADNIDSINFDKENFIFSLISGPEIFWISSFDQYKHFVSRSGLPLSKPAAIPAINYVFSHKDKQIVALEMDLRDRQNEFPVYQGENIKSYAIDSQGKILTVLDGDTLKLFELR